MFFARVRHLSQRLGIRLAFFFTLICLLSALLSFGAIYLLLSRQLKKYDQNIIEAKWREYSEVYRRGGVDGLKSELVTEKMKEGDVPLLVQIVDANGNSLFLKVPEDSNGYRKEIDSLLRRKNSTRGWSEIRSPHEDDRIDFLTAPLENQAFLLRVQVYQTRMPYLRDTLLAKVRVTDITSKVVDLWLEELLKSPTAKNPGRKSFGKEIELLSNVFNWYRENRNEAFVNPLTNRHREKARYKDVAPRRQDYFIRPEEVRDWIGWLKEHRQPVYWQLATFLVLTGCRIGEACALKWEAIDFNMRIARVVRTIYWDHHTKHPVLTDTTKTQGSNRIIALPEELLTLLLEMKNASGGSEWIFPGKKGNALKYNAIQSAFNAGFVALGLPWRSTHICRHTFATISLLATDSLSGVQASLGHTKQSMTEKYAKVVAMLKTGNAEKTASLFGLNRNHTQITHVDFRKRKRS